MSRVWGKLNAPLILVILTNCVPIFFVMFLGWSLIGVVTVFWVESIVLGIFAIPRMLLAQSTDTENSFFPSMIRSWEKDSSRLWVALAMFPAGYFGACLISGIILAVSAEISGIVSHAPIARDPVRAIGQLLPSWWELAAVVLVVRHAASFVLEYICRQEYRTATFSGEAARPFMWSMYLYIAIPIGAGFAIRTNAWWILAIALIAGKTCIEAMFVSNKTDGARSSSSE